MPLYDFKCGDCGAVIEAQVPIHARNATLVCHCGGRAERVFSVCSISIDRGHNYNGKYRCKCESDLQKESPYELAVKQWKHIKRMGGSSETRGFRRWENKINKLRKDKSVSRFMQDQERREREERQGTQAVLQGELE
jgi:putative FmdB family regulatory protein